VLKPGGRAVISEPTTLNPFANLYRKTLGPKEWSEITHYFDAARFALLKELFDDTTLDPFYFFGFLSYIWQFSVPASPVFRASLAVTQAIDKTLFTVLPPLRRLAWFKVFSGIKQ
jgi:hypothetical protein